MNNSSVEYDRLFKAIGERANNIFFLYDLELKKFTYLSPAFERIWEKPFFESTEISTLKACIHPDDLDYVTERIQRFQNNTENDTIELRILVKNKVKFIRLSLYQVTDRKVITGYAEDITDVKSFEENVRNINLKKNTLLEVLSHDLTSPISLIEHMTELINKEIKKENNDKIEEYLHLIKKVCKRSIDLIADLVNQEFLESENTSLKKERLDIVAKVNITLEILKASENNLGKTFTLVHSSPAIYMVVDEVKFMQVITNLLSNAIKFTYEDGQIVINIVEEDDRILLSIKDNGIGIPNELKPYIFERFTRAKRPGIKGEKSVGLGMAIIKRIVELHEGKIWLESEENRGTAFYIAIPR
jgi:two-component system, OmpR family, sensor histidine kinase VicK